ncbi:myo-inositol 2-dehydrogenase/D-chiro-inositol 1-dehydrogenase/scyllo-inositol 2-dehydrogenase (NAD+) [Deinococcus metalli]|uniref:Myo-inositol 2-dehydrogenase/D-chiro-inositol 1-dehydrogenase/scyllo-inositol 2-dehydrogenase (NAD+) n=1 Tax=Deinococcus metalli TaxID=1141878 RepID=A0A7W8KFP4_9DEIO|nr:inositol 2-dehydrogenase [Deinococcus metalli]MBB5375689.1 myo-inositol 2-dehydrogenase/D-chiro-inositol 1-dehydrogenase/scyllo-inositol 2-dehydrogenase (NAD+) [Deinococcus metalli]GHF37757.1 scyllo-inositol 2-dehydrogenase (NAD(+)) [Deinococcus metalli]
MTDHPPASPRPGGALRCAMIGAGRMGQAHAQVLATVRGVQITWVMDVSEDHARHVAAELGAQASTDLAHVLAQPDVEAVLISTPAGTHADAIEAAARAGKAIFTEKPLAKSLEDAARAVRAVEAAGVPNQVGFQRRYDPAYVDAKRRIDAGELGRLEGFRAVGRDPEPPPTGYLITAGGLMVDMGGHDLDLARFLVGEVTEVRAIGGALVKPELADHGEHDTALALLRFENGALGTLEVGLRTAYGYDIRTEVLGERGRLHIEQDRRPDLTVYDARGVSHDRPRHFSERFPAAYAAEITAFARGVQTGHALTPSVRDALHSLQLALAAQHALVTGETVRVPEFGEEIMNEFPLEGRS